MLRLSCPPAPHTASPLRYVFGMAKSQAVSWAHFHMARTSRVKPMSLGFSSPRISRCFIMAMNSLLLSSPFPGEDRRTGRGEDRGTVDSRGMMKWWWNSGRIRAVDDFFTHHHSRTKRTPHHRRDPTAPPWPQCGPPASWLLRDRGREAQIQTKHVWDSHDCAGQIIQLMCGPCEEMCM